MHLESVEVTDVEVGGNLTEDAEEMEEGDDVPLRVSAGSSCIEGENVWRFKDFGNGQNYRPHSSNCTSVGKVRGCILRNLMKPSIEANRSMKRKQVKQVVTGAGSTISLANLPLKSSMYRQ